MPRKPAPRSKNAPKRNSKRNSKRKNNDEGLFDAVRWDAVAKTARPAGIGLGVVAAGVTLVFGIAQLNARAADHLGASVDVAELPIKIDWPVAPGAQPGQTWLPQSEQTAVLRVARDAVRSTDTLSAAPLADIARALADSGWFEGLPAVQRNGRGDIVVTGTWRVPAAVVRYGGWDHLLSWSAMPLPRRYGPGTSNQRVILNPALGPGPVQTDADRYRQPWPGEDVAGALKLLGILAERGLVTEVEAIDVDHHAAGRVEIVTIHNTRIEWGAAPGEWKPGQATDEERLTRLERLKADYGRIDGRAKLVRLAGAHVERLGTP